MVSQEQLRDESKSRGATMSELEKNMGYMESLLEASIQGEYAQIHNAKRSIEDLNTTIMELENLVDMLKQMPDQ
jgi:archaellum component FlaC